MFFNWMKKKPTLRQQLASAKEEARNKQAIINHLQAEIYKLNGDLAQKKDRWVLEGKQAVKDVLDEQVLRMTLEQLREFPCKPDIYLVDDKNDLHYGQWAVVDCRCQYGGCDMPTHFPEEHMARIYAAVMTICKIPVEKGLCTECAKEYYGDMY